MREVAALLADEEEDDDEEEEVKRLIFSQRRSMIFGVELLMEELEEGAPVDCSEFLLEVQHGSVY